ncbi:hypothetical protein KIH27_18595 [Mycobacterium sp. M1]|uniref:Uncharacterized protein n=1 Tax=Mycolicibacter acidiphilus TaxID=2835306 RepID=A0ABS5RPT3_9MYCO|nr:hypothetical protein [Mycolicibacter acidiphilus]MBS9535599.1 hypothetical protein [Mycolicibacter acidiphilus]
MPDVDNLRNPVIGTGEGGNVMARDMFGNPLIAGVNADPIDIGAGLRALGECGYDEPRTRTVVEYALQRWARGEEEAAERGAIDQSFYGIDFGSWRRVLAAAMTSATTSPA